jgi:hypothetical protein
MIRGIVDRLISYPYLENFLNGGGDDLMSKLIL